MDCQSYVLILQVDEYKNSFNSFEEEFGGKVFVVFSTRVGNKKDIVNKNVLEEIKKEIERLKKM